MAKISEVEVTADKVYRRKLFSRLTKVVFILLLIIISLVYFILYLIYNGKNFTVSVDKDLASSNIFLSETGELKAKNRELNATAAEYMDNISVNWIKQDIDTEADGTHNGDNYFAYSFYIINGGKQTINYWYEIDIDDTIKNLDKAIRVMIYHNGIKTIYAKANEKNGKAEVGTKTFFSDTIAVLEEKKAFKPKDKDHFTVVVFIEGDDPDCNNELIGGGIKMHMDITEERIERK